MKSLKILFATFIALSATSAWADLLRTDKTVCSPIVHFKVPISWQRAYIVIGGTAHAMPVPDENGWTVIDFSNTKAVGTNNDNYFFINSANDNICQENCVVPNQFGARLIDARSVGFSCSTFEKGNKSWVDGGEVWIQDHPDVKQSGKTYITYTEPKVFDFYIFLPSNTTWNSAAPYISETDASGKTKDVALSVDPEYCGWYYRRYIEEEFPTTVVIHRDDDTKMEDAIGMNGAWEEGAAKPIPLKDLFDLYSTEPNYNKAIYFVADAEQAALLPSSNMGWYVKRPEVTGKCSYGLAFLIYDTDASLHGAFTCSPDWTAAIEGTDKVFANACFYPSVKFPVVTNDTTPMPCIGVTKGMVESTLDPTTKKMKLTTTGKKCFGVQADEAFAAMFNYTKGINEEYCLDVPLYKTPDNRFEFNSDYYQFPGAKVPGGFYPAEASPAAVMMMSERLTAAESKRKAEGPVFFTTDAYNTKSTSPEGLRTIHTTEGEPIYKLICNGPGWDGGIDCEGLYAAGSEFGLNNELTDVGKAISEKFKVSWCGDGWGWSCPNTAPEGWRFYVEDSENLSSDAINGSLRWTSTDGEKNDDRRILTTAGRNMHFCSESHATFRFKKNLKFSISGNDDIWVYIDNKLAVDIGGNHLAAPGYVDLDKFMPNAEIGKTYDIDIYYCNRRTPTSNLDIKTNIFIEQTTGITTEDKQDTKKFIETGDNIFKLCYKKSGGGSCAAAMGGGREDCTQNIKEPISYVFTQDKTGKDPTKEKIGSDAFAANPVQYDGGIDVSKPYAPVINEDKLKSILPSGKYYLIIKIGSDQKAIEITIRGSLAVANRDAVTVDENGNYSLPYEFKSQAMASNPKKDGTIDVNQMIPLYVAAILDPCSSTDCTDPLEMQLSPGQEYNLQVSNPKAQFYAMKNGKLEVFNPIASRKISNGGVDTIYVTIPFDEMENAVENVSINVKGSARKAEIKFFVPRIVFVDSDSTFKVVTGDKDTDPPRLMGSAYELYLVALNGDDLPCTNCNFTLTKGSKTSSGINIIDGGEVVNGRAKITIMSSIGYCREEWPGCKGTATLHVVGPSSALMQAEYKNMLFEEPPVSTPLFADIFDVHGATPQKELDIPSKYFSMEQEYLDGIGDSLVIYYHRNFHKDSLPVKIAVFWENDKDSVLFEKDEIAAGAVCGATAKLDKQVCLPKISLSGKKLSKEIKTSGYGRIKSWATYTARGATVTTAYDGVIYDRIAPVIVSANASIDKSTKKALLKVTFSEPVQKTEKGIEEGDKVFSFYITNGKKPKFTESLNLAQGVTFGTKFDSVQTFFYDQNSTYPQAGDYIHVRSIKGVGLLTDQSNYKNTDSIPGAEGLRATNESSYNWNYVPGYDATKRLPSPWVKITQGSAEGKDPGDDKDKVYAKPSFRIELVAPFEFAIVFDENLPSLAKQYVVMDMKGQVLSVGNLSSNDTRVKVPTSGSYIVNVGYNYRRVNVK